MFCTSIYTERKKKFPVSKAVPSELAMLKGEDAQAGGGTEWGECDADVHLP